ncbi:MAG: hypothetical protein Q9216_005171, partial [Gyalolechia sp. 2 TL-2023]
MVLSTETPDRISTSSKAPPNRLAAKATAAPPQVTAVAKMETDNTDDSGSKLPLHQDIMQLARLGEIGPIQKLFDEGTFQATYTDAENITPLHWAAINNHYALCQFLIEHGADVNAVGGETEATPAHWAVQRCHYYTVNLLLQHGADPTIADGQGYKVIHLATFDGNTFMLLIILLHPSVSIDEPDAQGHTALMWAAYNQSPIVVDLLMRFGASISAVDETGFMPLHWALVRGSPHCISRLLENGADRFAVTSTDKTPSIIGEEMKTTRAWHRALQENGYNDDATVKRLPVPYISFIKNPSFLNKFFFLCPFFVLLLVFTLLSTMVIYAAIPVSLFCAYCLQWAAQQVLLWAPSNMKHLQNTPPKAHPRLIAKSILALMPQDLENVPPPAENKCHLLSEELCGLVLRDPYTVVLGVWCTLQFSWMVMLLIVQSVQIARALTTYESMRSHAHRSSPAAAAITSAITAGTTSLRGASLTDSGVGPDPVAPPGLRGGVSPRKEGYFAQWKKLLGLDTFIATATGRSGRRKRGNPFSRGVFTNCRDFWFDPAPYFGQRESGAAMLDGEAINYTRIYESPSRIKTRRAREQGGGAYQSLKLSQVALRYKVNKTTAKELLRCLERLHESLHVVSRFLDSKLADYVFFPLSHIFGESKRLPSRVLELALACLRLLIVQGWRQDLSSEIGKQLLILLAFLAGGSATEAKSKDVHEDVGTIAFDSTARLFQSSVASSLGSNDTVSPENIPLLGHAVTVILDGISNGSASDVRLAAGTALEALVVGIQDHEAIQNFFPGIVSCLTKVLASSVKSKTPYKVLEACIHNLDRIICKIFSKDAPLSTETGIGASQDIETASKSWVQATSGQVKIALSTTLPLRYHERPEIQDAFFSFCISLLTRCRESLINCTAMVLETLIILSSPSSLGGSAQRRGKLKQVLAADPDLADPIREVLYNWIVALPRAVGSDDDTKQNRTLQQLAAAVDLLSAQSVELKPLNHLMASNLQSSIATIVQLSANSTIRSLPDDSADVGRILQNTALSRSTPHFTSVFSGPSNRNSVMTGLQILIRYLQESSMSMAIKQHLAGSLRTTSNYEQIGNLWLMLQLSEHAFSGRQETDQWLNIANDGVDQMKEETYAFALEVLDNSAYDDTVDWRLQALSLEMVALQARSQAQDFRPELVDALYPILERMGSSNAALQQHAVTCLSIVSNACKYSSASELVVDNADYLVNAVAVKLNTFDISPQASQVMLMMVRLCGADLIPYLDDLIESIFAILACYHGYPRFVESLFEVLNAIVEEGGKSSPLAIDSMKKPTSNRRQPYKPTSIADLITRLEDIKAKTYKPDSA